MADDSKRETPQIFDLVFKRLIQETSPGAVIALINGLFGTDFPPDSPVSFPNKEKVTEDLRQIVSDMLIRVAGELFHLDAQIDDDLNMVLRMFRYGYHEALNKKERGEDGSMTIVFPQARVLYWETTRKTPDQLTLHIIFPDKSRHDFVVPAFKVLEHEIEDLERKKLALLLPFYTLKYRKRVKAAGVGEKRLELVSAVEGTFKRVVDAVEELRKTGLLTAEDAEFIMGEAQILYAELYEPYKEFREARMLLEERLENPFVKARRESRAEGRAEGMAEGMVKVARNLLKAGVSRDIIAQATGLTIADLEKQSVPASAASGS
jgi:predicted transposase/invertase (TIGR01784 family)